MNDLLNKFTDIGWDIEQASEEPMENGNELEEDQ